MGEEASSTSPSALHDVLHRHLDPVYLHSLPVPYGSHISFPKFQVLLLMHAIYDQPVLSLKDSFASFSLQPKRTPPIPPVMSAMAVTNTPSGEGKVSPLAATGTQHVAPREDKPLVKPESYLNLATDEDRRAFCAARQMAKANKRAASDAEPPELRRKRILNELLRSQEPVEKRDACSTAVERATHL